MRRLSILVLALALVAAGCGGGDDDSSVSDTTTVEETTTEETTEETTDDGTATSGDFDFADEDCRGLVAAFLGVSQAFAAAAGGSDAELQEQAEAFSEFADDVPEEIRADVQTLADAYGQYIDVLQDAGLQPGELPTAEQAQQLQNALQAVGTADVTAASERLGTWTTENCSG
jgi:ABC-type glycerol-3-phosphate transport system substrate-binding protein